MTTHYEDPRISPTVVVSIVFVMLVAMTVFGLQAYFGRAAAEEFEEKVERQPDRERALVLTEQRERMSAYRWIDEEGGTVAIPIERAMELVVQELGTGGGDE